MKVQAHIDGGVGKQDLILMFTASWCGPCHLVHKELAKLGALRPASAPRLSVLSLDVDSTDENKALASKLHITSLPTLIFVGQDTTKPAISTVGNVSYGLIADVLNSKMDLCGADLATRLRLS